MYAGDGEGQRECGRVCVCCLGGWVGAEVGVGRPGSARVFVGECGKGVSLFPPLGRSETDCLTSMAMLVVGGGGERVVLCSCMQWVWRTCVRACGAVGQHVHGDTHKREAREKSRGGMC